MPVTAPPRKATLSAGPMPPRAASATRVLARTDTFMPMKPAAAEARPPIAKPIATSMFCSGISAMNRTTPTTPIDRVLALQVGLRALLDRRDRFCIVSLPGDSASSERVVTTP